jgi:Arc/MetJ-type ribon-helix-helix transcriptional regulator
MPLTTLRLSRQEKARLIRLSKKRRVSRSEVIRQGLLALEQQEPRTLLDDWADLVGIVKNAPADLSHHRRHLKGYGE